MFKFFHYGNLSSNTYNFKIIFMTNKTRQFYVNYLIKMKENLNLIIVFSTLNIEDLTEFKFKDFVMWLYPLILKILYFKFLFLLIWYFSSVSATETNNTFKKSVLSDIEWHWNIFYIFLIFCTSLKAALTNKLFQHFIYFIYIYINVKIN